MSFARLVGEARRLWRRRRAHNLFRRSGLFDAAWYAGAYPDAAASPMDHYLEHGAAEGRRPHPLFDGRWYTERHADVAQSGANPLIHYLMSGDAEGRDPNPYFATRWYRAANPDARGAPTALSHYARVGAKADKDPSPLFDARWYAQTNPDVAASGLGALAHFLTIGRAEGRKPTALGEDSFKGEPVNAARLEAFRALGPVAGETVALMVAHCPEGVLKPNVGPYVAALARAGVKVVLIAAADRPFTPDPAVTAMLAAGFVRENRGFDFAAWAHLLRAEPGLCTASTLLLVNDSVIGPMTQASLDDLLARVRNSPADVVGATESREYVWHLQSWFLALKAPVLSSAAFHHFVGQVRSLDDKDHVIKAYELTLTARLQGAGFACAAAWPSRDDVNQTVFHWRDLLGEGFPFVKTLTIRGAYPDLDIEGWPQALADAGFDAAIAEATVAASERKVEKIRGAWTLLKAPARPAEPRAPFKLAFIGPWNYASGLGGASRGYLSALWRTGVRLNLHPVERPFHIHARVAPTVNVREFDGQADAVVVHMNPDGWHLLTEDQHTIISRAQRRVGLFVWEMAHIPEEWSLHMRELDAVWAPSRYCADVFARSGLPVEVVPHVVPVGSNLDGGARARTLAMLGLADDARIVLYAFDGASYLVRKNPEALVRAFAASGLAGEGWRLVLKTKHLMDRAIEGGKLKALAEGPQGVVLIDRALAADEMGALFAAADIYASPHRSEGFGLTIAEAMAAGKPVVATDYGGSRDFLDASCGYPVPGAVKRLERSHGHYTKGGQWAEVDEAAFARALRAAADGLAAGEDVGMRARARIAERLSPDAVAQAFRAALGRVIAAPERDAA